MLQELINKLEEVTSWRLQELSNIELELKAISEEDNKSFLLRGAIALIYAHWEGAVKDMFKAYNSFLNNLLKENSLPLNKNTVFILELLLHKNKDDVLMQKIFWNIYNLNKLLNNNSISLNIYQENLRKNILEAKNLDSKNEKKLQHVENFLETSTNNVSIVANVVNTKSNLGFEELKKILEKFDIPLTDDIEIQRYPIKQLLKHRNDIAHGENAFFDFRIRDVQTMKNTLKIIEDLIRIIRGKIEQKAMMLVVPTSS